MRPRHRRNSGHGVSRDRWLLSYADFITLLFAFFTTMYAISTVDQAKLSKVAMGLHQALDSPDALPNAPGRIPASSGTAMLSQEQLNARVILEKDMAEDLRSGRMELLEDGRGLVLSIPEASAFGTGSADLSDTAQQAVARLAASLAKMGNSVLIEGHTDDVPIHTPRFASNWELSTARATAVVQWLVERGGIEPARLSAAGYGEYRPRVANESAQARARNRRVDVVILKGPQS
ncbi:MAG: OmpA family protein [Acidobacteria bacterium]|nr:OmpA family protein [Acidobacteriota bacterium]